MRKKAFTRIITMKKYHVGLLMMALTGFLTFGYLANLNMKKQYKPGDYVPEQDAYFVETIDDPAGLAKAHKFVTPTDNKYSSQKTRSLGTSLIGDIESVWTSYTGEGTTVAIIDDGFDYDHPEYTRANGTSAILSTSRYYYASGNSAYYKSYSEDPTCIGEDWDSDEKEWATHGTNTSTTAAAPMNNGGGVGIAPGANILALKIDFSFVAIKAAIQYAISQNVDVINMSLGAYSESFTDGWGDSQSGSSSTSTYLNSVCQSAYNAGIIVVAAAGNESTWHKSYPACNTKVIGVGALGDWDNKGNANELAEFTNYVDSSQTGEINVDILAPGYVYTATQGGSSSSSHTHTYSDTQGTSFSSPIIAGAACLWKQKYPNGTPDEFLTQLQTSADGIGYYTNKYIPVSGWDSSLSDVGPSNITNGRLNVANLMSIDDPHVDALQSSINISVGEKKQINLSSSNGSISYSSSNTSVATVTNSGLVEGVGAGTATITVTASKNGKTATDTVTVTVAAAVAATSISFSPKTVTLSVGETYNAEETITVTPSNASRIFLFESENESVATVDVDTGLVTAVSAGTATINAIAGYGNGDDSLTVTVEASAATVSDTLTRPTTGIAADSTVYADWSGKSGTSGAVYAGNSAGGNDSIQIRSNNSNSGIVSTTSGGKITKVTVSWNASTSGRVLQVYGKNTAYSSASDLYGSNSGTQLGSIDSDSQTELNISGSYSYVGVRSSSGALYMDSITFTWGSGSSTPTPTVNSVTVSPSSLSLDVYNNPTSTLSASVSGTNSPAQTVTWSSSNTNVATVSSSGAVTAKAAGTATITATSTVDTTKKGTCTVTVTDSTPKTLSSIALSGQTTTFNVGDTFSFGGTVTAHFSDSSTSDVTSSATFTGYNMDVAGNYTVTVSYTYGGTTKTATYQITVKSSGGSGTVTTAYTIGWGTATGDAGTYTNFTTTSGSVTDILSFTTSQNGSNNAPAYNEGYSELRLYYNSSGNGGYITITPAEGMTFTGFEMETSTTPTVKYSVNGGSLLNAARNNTTYSAHDLEVTSSLRIQNANTSNTQLRILTIALFYEVEDTSDKIVSSLSASYSGGSVYVGNELDTSKVSVTASYTDSVKYPNETLDSSDYSITGFSSTNAGNKVVTVTYTGSLATLTTPLTTTFNVNVINDSVTNVVVTNTKTYHPGETISKSDITVTLSWASGKASTTTSDFTFSDDGYQFTYSDAPSGGSNGTKNFSIIYAGHEYNFTVNVSRTAYQTISSSSTTISSSQFNSSTVSKSSGTPSSTAVTIGGTAFTVTTNAYIFSQSSVYYLSFGKTAGSICNTNAFASDLTSVSFVEKASGRQDGVLSISKDGTNYVTYSSEEIAKGGYRYFKIEYIGNGSGSGASEYSNIQSISYSLSGQDNAINVANYIMYEDTNNQCTTKLDIAIDKLNSMSSSEKSTFWTSNSYVIVTARERLSAWAVNQGKTLTYNGSSFVVASRTNVLNPLGNISPNNIMVIVLVISGLSISIAATYLCLKKKKHN